MKLDQALESSNLEVFNRLLDKSVVGVSIWGSRLIKVEGYEGGATLGQCVKILNKKSFWLDVENQLGLSLKDRVSAIKCSKELNFFYFKTDEAIKTVNFVKKFFHFLQELFNIHGDSRFYKHSNRFSVIDKNRLGNPLHNTLIQIPKETFQIEFPTLKESDWAEYDNHWFTKI